MDIVSWLIGYKAGLAKGGGSGGGSGEGSGGGSSADVRYVTFMSHDGSVELGKKAVAVGDDCADPIARGVFATPTKESTAQYAYSFVGWATTPNGAWDESALDAVTENKTVYAAYAAAVRYYTITFYDDDGVTVLKTESLAYGATPSYTPAKDKYEFVGWTPALSVVTGAASYTATWKQQVGFAVATWAEISAITTAGTSANTFAVGDTRRETLTYSNGTTEEIELVIAKIRKDGTMVLALNHALKTLKQMHNSITQARAGWDQNDLGIYLLNTVAPALPEELLAVIRPLNTNAIRLPTQENLTTTGDSIFLNQEGLPLFSSASNRIRKQGINGAAITYWTSAYTKSGSYYYFNHINTSGNYVEAADGASGVTTERGVVFLLDV